REIPRVPDGVAYSRIQERRPSSESTIEMVGEIPGRMAGAKSLFFVCDWRRQMNLGTVIERPARIIEQQVQERIADANPGHRSRVTSRNRSGCVDKVGWNSCIHCKMACKVVAQHRGEVIHACGGAVATFEPFAQRPPCRKSFGILAGRILGRRQRSLRHHRGTNSYAQQPSANHARDAIAATSRTSAPTSPERSAN